MGLIFVMALLGHDEYTVRELASAFPYPREHLLVLISETSSQEARIRAERQLAKIAKAEEIYFFYWHREYYYHRWIVSEGRLNRSIGDERFIKSVQSDTLRFNKISGYYGWGDSGPWSRPNYIEVTDHNSLHYYRERLRWKQQPLP